MSGILFQKILFGPIHSRRLGRSLGINLLPEDLKLCTFNCVYCECGWAKTDKIIYDKLLSKETIISVLRQRFAELHQQGLEIDSITYSGNGEPTLHPDFAAVTDELIRLRNKYFPQTVISCLSNSTQLFRQDVFEALQKIDNRILKLDAGQQRTLDLINKPFAPISIDEITNNLAKFNGDLTVQTLFLRGESDGQTIDNTTDEEVEAWLERLKIIKPQKVMMYPIDRETPAKNLKKISKEEMETIAEKVQRLGITTLIY